VFSVRTNTDAEVVLIAIELLSLPFKYFQALKVGKVMRRVIRNRAGFYLKADGTWTADWEQGADFRGTIAVISAEESLCLKEVSMVLIIEDSPSPEYDVVLPLEDARG
jgi:hypothetical protein